MSSLCFSVSPVFLSDFVQALAPIKRQNKTTLNKMKLQIECHIFKDPMYEFRLHFKCDYNCYVTDERRTVRADTVDQMSHKLDWFFF